MSHDKGSFDYKAINENIRNLLDVRSELDNTIQVSMPFVKATTTIKLPELGNGNIGFTLGLHAIDQDVKYENIYASKNSDMPLIGYTYTEDGKTERVYASDPNAEIFSNVFNSRSTLYKTTNFIRIPPPGITKVTVGRNKNGLLAMGQLEISVPSLIQLESLHRTFLVPGIGMVLEWGQQFAPELRPSLGELSDISSNLFPWTNRTEAMDILNKLATNQLGLPEILEKYVYPSQGQYMWMFGRVANFNVKSNSDGSFNCTVKIVGPSEDSWAYSTDNTVIPAKDESTKYFCASDTTSVASYFTDTVAGGLNLKTLLDNTKNGNGVWKDHVQFFEGGNKKGGEPTAAEKKPTVGQTTFGDSEDAYFMTWRFFVNMVLNSTSEEYKGIKYIFTSALGEQELARIGLLLPYATGPDRSNTNVAKLRYIDDPMESFVGMNNFLRTVDPSIMVIVNERAAIAAEKNPQYNIPDSDVKFFEKNTETAKFYNPNDSDPRGLFELSTSGYQSYADRGFLSTGVWLNHKAVVKAMLGGTTILRGIVNLLEDMNRATKGYWKLAIDAAEPEEGSAHSYNYMVVDANFRESSDRAVSNFIDNVHTFNKYVRVDETTGKLVGSELTECSIDLSLPKTLFTQIATLGLVQPEDMKKIADLGKTKEEIEEEAKKLTNPSGPKKSPKISDPNDTLREMFAITSLAGRDKNGNFSDEVQGPDITTLPKGERAAIARANGACGTANTQTTAQAAGMGAQAGGIDINANLKDKSIAQLKEEQTKAKTELESEVCKKCQTCPPPVVTTATTQPTNKKLSQLTIAEIRWVQKPAGSVLAVGKYQTIPDTLSAWIRSEKVPLDTVFNSDTQEKLGSWLITSKRPNVAQYVAGSNTVTLEEAQLSLAQEFASLPVPGTPESKKGYYDGTAGNRASVTSGTVQKMLIDARSKNNLQLVKEFIAKGEGNYDALNRGTAGDTRTDSAEYYTALNQRKSSTGNDRVCSDDAYVEIGTIGFDGTIFRDSQIKEGKARCGKCVKAASILKQTTTVSAEKEKAVAAAQTAIREFPGMNQIFRYIEIFPDYMVTEITDSADGVFANAFGASPGSLAISGDISMPGIAGLRVGELFWIDRIPTFYKAFGAFQIMSIEDSIGTEGWTTKVHAYFNYLGLNWKTAVAQKLKNAASTNSVVSTNRTGT